MSRQTVSIDTIRTLAHGSISSSFAAVGTPLTQPVRLVCITNNTDGDMFFSVDGTNNQLFLAAGSYKTFDFNTNRTHVDQYWVLPIGTQFYVAYSTAPSKNSVYIECLWGQ